MSKIGDFYASTAFRKKRWSDLHLKGGQEALPPYVVGARLAAGKQPQQAQHVLRRKPTVVDVALQDNTAMQQQGVKKGATCQSNDRRNRQANRQTKPAW
jgi:hypothetical protein